MKYSIYPLVSRKKFTFNEKTQIINSYTLANELVYSKIIRRSKEPYIKHIYNIIKNTLEDEVINYDIITTEIFHDFIEEGIKLNYRQIELEHILSKKVNQNQFENIIKLTHLNPNISKEKHISELGYQKDSIISILSKGYDIHENCSDLENMMFNSRIKKYKQAEALIYILNNIKEKEYIKHNLDSRNSKRLINRLEKDKKNIIETNINEKKYIQEQ